MKKLCYLLLAIAHLSFAQTNPDLWDIPTSESVLKHIKGVNKIDTYAKQNAVLSELYTMCLTSLTKDYYTDNAIKATIDLQRASYNEAMKNIYNEVSNEATLANDPSILNTYKELRKMYLYKTPGFRTYIIETLFSDTAKNRIAYVQTGIEPKTTMSTTSTIEQQTSTCYGYINVEMLLENYPAYKVVESKIARLEKDYQLEITQMEQELSKKMELYHHEAVSKSQAENDARAEEVETMKQHIKNRVSQINDEFDTKRADLRTPVIEQIKAAIKNVASQRGLSVVLDISVINEQNTLVSDKGTLFMNAINLLYDVEKALGITNSKAIQTNRSEPTPSNSTVCFGYLDWNSLYISFSDNYPSIATTISQLEDSYKLEISNSTIAYHNKLKKYSDEASLQTEDENLKRAKEMEVAYEDIKKRIAQLQNDLETKTSELYAPALENAKATVQSYINLKNIPYVIDASFIDDHYFIVGNSQQFFQLGLNLMDVIKKELGFK